MSSKLTHTYIGFGLRLDPGLGWRPQGEPEHIKGSFRVIQRSILSATIGNGENPEQRWLIPDPENLFREHSDG